MPSAPSRRRWRPTRGLGSWQSTNWAISAIDKFGADCLFQIISHRYERGATLLTTNRTYKQSATIFNGDATLTSALDRSWNLPFGLFFVCSSSLSIHCEFEKLLVGYVARPHRGRQPSEERAGCDSALHAIAAPRLCDG